MTPMDTVYGVPFVLHESEDKAREAAWKQAVESRCKVMLVEHDQYFEIDGEAMGRMLESQGAVNSMFKLAVPIQFSEPSPFNWKCLF